MEEAISQRKHLCDLQELRKAVGYQLRVAASRRLRRGFSKHEQSDWWVMNS